jgi:hypothetical protein
MDIYLLVGGILPGAIAWSSKAVLSLLNSHKEKHYESDAFFRLWIFICWSGGILPGAIAWSSKAVLNLNIYKSI